jgi:hypothetical protein
LFTILECCGALVNQPRNTILLGSVSTLFYRPVPFKHSPQQFVAKHPHSILFTDVASPVNDQGKGKKGKVFPVHDKLSFTEKAEVEIYTFLNSAQVNYEAFN